MRDVHLHLVANYQFITDPPLLADIGYFNLNMHNVTFLIQGTTAFTEGIFDINLNKINLDLNPYTGGINFDGISDTSDVISRFITFAINVVSARIDSFSKYPKFLPKINKIINGLIDLLPDEIDIPMTDLYLEGGMTNRFEIKKNSFLELPLDASLQKKNDPYT